MAYPKTPKLLFGLSKLDAEANMPRCLSLVSAEINARGFELEAAAFKGCRGNSIGCNWLTLPNDLHLETDSVFTGAGDRGEYVKQIIFSQDFAFPPKIAVWLQEFERHDMGFLSLKCRATDITPHSFNLRIESWSGRNFQRVRAQYLAYPLEEDGLRVRSGRTMVPRSLGQVWNRAPFYTKPFKKQPATFVAISELDFNSTRKLRFECKAEARDVTELEWSCGTSEDSDMDHAEIQWIAIE
jgi:hypothetical protein